MDTHWKAAREALDAAARETLAPFADVLVLTGVQASMDAENHVVVSGQHGADGIDFDIFPSGNIEAWVFTAKPSRARRVYDGGNLADAVAAVAARLRGDA